ncbi:CinA family protein [Planctobacterium marinum]|uniref:CinA family protein n=1 Tax=Planctobacterium marinum TaxID=1631968 RepID=UPI001E35E79E|nr:nicotinamide-nucleotide amidohydrolase family protein [Planctobacterium marinum]MCC2603829.1 nicotinamide-nucleotide amidohydrolase family protein [Planctobacterium marinum]
MISDQILTLSAQLGELLTDKNWQITCAESCTGGGIGYAITSASGSSNWFHRGFITYSNEAKSDLVAVDPQIINKHGAVSQPVVEQMSLGALKAANANVSVAVSGVAGPGGGTQDKPVGLVWFGFIVGDEHFAFSRIFTGDRARVREQTIEVAMQTLTERLAK